MRKIKTVIAIGLVLAGATSALAVKPKAAPYVPPAAPKPVPPAPASPY